MTCCGGEEGIIDVCSPKFEVDVNVEPNVQQNLDAVRLEDGEAPPSSPAQFSGGRRMLQWFPSALVKKH